MLEVISDFAAGVSSACFAMSLQAGLMIVTIKTLPKTKSAQLRTLWPSFFVSKVGKAVTSTVREVHYVIGGGYRVCDGEGSRLASCPRVLCGPDFGAPSFVQSCSLHAYIMHTLLPARPEEILEAALDAHGFQPKHNRHSR